MIGLALAVVLAASEASPAARVAGDAISLAEVDAATEGRAAALEANLVETAGAIVREIVAGTGENVEEVVLSLPTGPELASPLEPPRVVARSPSGSVTASALESRGALRLYRLRGELARVRRRALDEIVEERLLAQEAGRRDIAVEDLVEPARVEEAEVAALVAAEEAAGRPAADPARVRPLLEARARHRARGALVAKLRGEAKVEILLGEVAPPRLTVSSRPAPALGPADGPTILLFADYRRPAARRMHREMDRLRSLRPDVRVVLRDFVSDEDPATAEAAFLVRCADRLGGLDAMRAALLSRDPPAPGEPWLDAASRAQLAETLGVDAASLEACIESADMARAIRDDSDEIRALGFEEPPAMLLEGRPLAGLQKAETLAAALPAKTR
ncbi:MAG: hypothetical protein FJ144_28125 [Deltaproteobacteria bacterium]|nr:hypothetical protein [Deltaproteobacteria bacterium]